MRSLKIKGQTFDFYYMSATRLDAKRTVDASQRDQAIHEACGRCRACGCGSRHNLQGDHWYPHSKGGPTTAKNTIALCGGCNKIKGDVIPPKGYELPVFRSAVSEEDQNRNHDYFASLVATWRDQEQAGKMAEAKTARQAGRSLKSVLDDMFLSDSARTAIVKSKVLASVTIAAIVSLFTS